MDGFLPGIATYNLLGVEQQRMNVDRAGLDQLKLTASNPGQIEQVIDQSSFDFDVAPHHPQLLAKVRFDRTLLFQSSGTHKDWSERRSQLM